MPYDGRWAGHRTGAGGNEQPQSTCRGGVEDSSEQAQTEGRRPSGVRRRRRAAVGRPPVGRQTVEASPAPARHDPSEIGRAHV